MLFDAVLFNLQVIGESVKRISAEAKASVPDGDRSRQARMRDLIAHHYLAIDAHIVWEGATRHVLPMLGQARLPRDRFDRGDGATVTP